MNKLKHIAMLFLLSTPLLAVFTNHPFGLTLGFLWGFLAWCVVLGKWAAKEAPVFGIKSDILLQQHNQEAEEIEAAEAGVPQDVEKAKEPIVKNPFAR